jgi:hypothetical protein
MDVWSTLVNFGFLLAAFGSEEEADTPPIERTNSFCDEWSEKAKGGNRGRFNGNHCYWDKGTKLNC